jgi:hypothetical protein
MFDEWGLAKLWILNDFDMSNVDDDWGGTPMA